MRSLPWRNDLRKTKVGNFQMAININQDVLWLDVSINDVHVMQMLKTEKKFREVKLCLLFWKFLNFPKVEEHLSTGAKVHHEEQLSL